jgi:hypothetical protein
MSTSGPPQLPPDGILALAESQYRFGVGPILVRSIRVLAPVEFDGEPWWQIRAEAANGTRERHGGWLVRDLYVEDAALPVGPPT